MEGVEPSPNCLDMVLSHARMPIPPHSQPMLSRVAFRMTFARTVPGGSSVRPERRQRNEQELQPTNLVQIREMPLFPQIVESEGQQRVMRLEAQLDLGPRHVRLDRAAGNPKLPADLFRRAPPGE